MYTGFSAKKLKICEKEKLESEWEVGAPKLRLSKSVETSVIFSTLNN